MLLALIDSVIYGWQESAYRCLGLSLYRLIFLRRSIGLACEVCTRVISSREGCNYTDQDLWLAHGFGFWVRLSSGLQIVLPGCSSAW